ncbi:MAG: hypothetical protein HOV81_37540 [Kofleriaceae bacterium]|nr:hypothetical protein [Kofleriaceae bacterium]
MTRSLPLSQTRAHWWSRQRLGGAPKASLVEAIATSGWLRTLGGVDVYLAARARHAGMKRTDLDKLVHAGELRVVPAARGCIYLVPGSIVPDLMAWNADDFRASTKKDLEKAGKSLKDVEAIMPLVERALAKGPLSTDAIRKQLGSAIPSFGEAGKKVGLSSPLPPALRMLENAGTIERTLDGGKLDSTTYLWRKVSGKPARPSKDPFAAIVTAFLGFAGPATVAQIAAWSGRAQRDIKAVLAKLPVTSIAVADLGEAFVLSDQLAAVKAAKSPSGIAALAFEDNYLVNHGGLGVVSDPKHHAIEIAIWGGSKPETIGEAEHVLSRTIVVDGLVAGFWEVDPAANAAVWTTFDAAPSALAKKIDDVVQDAARFLLDEVGHARTYTQDSMELVQERANRIKKRAVRKKRA